METLFKDNVSTNNLKKLSENIAYLEKENEDLRERIYDLENSVSIHKTIMNSLSDDKNFDPQARYFTEQLNQESELLHKKIEKLTHDKSELRSQLVIKKQMEIQDSEKETDDVKTMREELEEMRQNLDRKEYLLQYWEERNTEMEKLLKKRALHDEYIKKRLNHLSIEPNKDRTIRNVVEDWSALREENEKLKKDNKSLKEQLDYAVSNAGDAQNPNELTIFANNIKPIPQFEELNRIKDQTKSKELYMRKLEEMVRASLEKLEKFKDELKASKSETSILKDRVEYFSDLNTKLKKALVKYKTKCEDLDQKINDQGVKVWVKENTGVMRVKPASMIQQTNSQDETGDIDDEIKIDIDLNDVKEAEEGEKDKEEERVVDEFAPKQDSFDKENGNGEEIGFHFPDASTIVINPDADEHYSDDEGIDPK